MPTQDCNGLYYIVKPISVYARTSTQGEVQYLIMHALFILYPNYIYMNILQMILHRLYIVKFHFEKRIESGAIGFENTKKLIILY